MFCFLPVPFEVRYAVKVVDDTREVRACFYRVYDRQRAADEWQWHFHHVPDGPKQLRKAAETLRKARAIAARNAWSWPEILAAARAANGAIYVVKEVPA